MKLVDTPRALIAPTLVAIAVAVATVLPQVKAAPKVIGSYSAVVCPGALAGATMKIALPSSKMLVRDVSGKNTNLLREKSNVIFGNSSPTFIAGNAGSELAFESISGTSTVDAVCDVGGADQWFVGGSAGVTSKSILEIINSGLSSSSVQIYPFNSKTSLAPIAITVKANSDLKISLASILPGDELVALHIVTDSGRVTSFLLDHRKSGLKDLGSSFVTPVSAPATTSFISGLFASPKKATSTMRFLVPGNVDANVHLAIYANGGTFTPLGFDSRAIAHQRVIDLPLPTISLSQPYGIEITSDQPILASVFTRTNTSGGKNLNSDYAWANQLTPLSRFALNLAGASAQFFFLGNSVSVAAQWRDSKGVAHRNVISGGTSALWRPQGALKGIVFTPLSKLAIYGGAIIATADGGLNYLPLMANPLVSGAPPVNTDLRTLTRR